MACDCEKENFPPQVLINVGGEKPVLFRLVRLPADFGTDEENPPKVGEYRNVLLNYSANNHTYIFSSDGIPVLLTGTAESTGIINFDELVNRPSYGGATMTSGTDIPDLSSAVSANHEAVGELGQEVGEINGKIPNQASAQNQLADKNFVNSSIGTNTAYYISNNGEPFSSLADLEAYSGTLTNNDYAFVVGTDQAGNTTYTRYKYNAETETWAEEYVLNNSSFTAGQWAAINSLITAALVSKLQNLPADAEANEIDSISVNGIAQTPDANKNVDLTIPTFYKEVTGSTFNTRTAEPGGYILRNNGSLITITRPDDTTWSCYDGDRIIVLSPTRTLYVGKPNTYSTYLWGSSTRGSIDRNFTLQCSDTLTSTSVVSPLSANQGRVLKDLVDAKAEITMTDTDPGEGVALDAGKFVAVYGGSN